MIWFAIIMSIVIQIFGAFLILSGFTSEGEHAVELFGIKASSGSMGFVVMIAGLGFAAFVINKFRKTSRVVKTPEGEYSEDISHCCTTDSELPGDTDALRRAAKSKKESILKKFNENVFSNEEE